MAAPLPKKLRNDAILEALLEVRFEPGSSIVTEVMFGRFADVSAWTAFRQVRLPTADIPAAIRRADPQLRYQPSIDLVSPDGGVAVRIGPQVITFSRRGHYPGWDRFGPELENLVTQLFRIVPEVQVSRLGLRYINALRSDVHGITSIDQTDISVCVAENKLRDSFNVNFMSEADTNFATMSRIASVDLAEGNIPENTSVIVDIDVYTRNGFSTKDANDVRAWVVEAHEKEKQNFFKILGRETTDRLRADE